MGKFWSGVVSLPKNEYRYCVVENYMNPEEGIFRRGQREMGNFKTKEEAIAWTKAYPIKDRHISFSIYRYKVEMENVCQVAMNIIFDHETK